MAFQSNMCDSVASDLWSACSCGSCVALQVCPDVEKDRSFLPILGMPTITVENLTKKLGAIFRV